MKDLILNGYLTYLSLEMKTRRTVCVEDNGTLQKEKQKRNQQILGLFLTLLALKTTSKRFLGAR
jgi:hypothetical protein